MNLIIYIVWVVVDRIWVILGFSGLPEFVSLEGLGAIALKAMAGVVVGYGVEIPHMNYAGWSSGTSRAFPAHRRLLISKCVDSGNM